MSTMVTVSSPEPRSGLKLRLTCLINVLSLLPRLIRDIPKLVVLGGGDRGIADFVSDERVGVPSANNTSVSPPDEWQPALLRK